MRRTFFLALGFVEILVALLLFSFAWTLPGTQDVNEHVSRVEKVTLQSSAEINRLHEQVHQLRLRQPQMKELADRLHSQSEDLITNAHGRHVDYETVQTVSDALGDVATGLDGFSETLDPKGMQQFGGALGATADYLDQQVAPGADRAADQMEKSTAALRTDAERLSKLLRDSPLDLKSAREVHESLGKFSEGLQRMKNTLKPENVATMREGFKGLEESLNTSADQVERLTGFTYPVVTFNGLKPHVDNRPFWPEGEQIADGMRKAARGATAAVAQMDELAQDLPKLRDGIEASQKTVEKTREAIGVALKQQQTVEPLLKDIPQHAARLAEELPRLGADLSKILRDTSRLKEVAGMLREAQKGINVAVARWPDLRKTLGRSAVLLRATQTQLNHALQNRHVFESSLEMTILLIRAITAALPALTEQLETNLLEQEQSLANLEHSVNEVSASLPEVANTAASLLHLTRLLMVLVGCVFALHGGFVMLSARPGALSSV